MGKNLLTEKKNFNRILFYFFCGISLVLFSIWFGLLLKNPEDQFRIFFRSGEDLFADFTNVMIYGRYRDPYGAQTPGIPGEHAYLPLSYLITFLFAKPFEAETFEGFDIWMNPQVLILITLFFAAVTAVLGIQIFAGIEGKNWEKFLGATAILSSGMYLSAFERGNLIILATCCTMFFVMNYDNENKVIKEMSFILLAVAASLKMTPAMFGLLLVINWKIKDAVKLLIYGVIFAIGPFVFIINGFSNIPTLLTNIKLNVEGYEGVIGCGMRSVPLLLMPDSNVAPTVFLILLIVLSIIIVVSLPVMKKKWHLVMGIALLSIMIPSHSATYNALFLIPALILMFNDKELKWNEALCYIPFLLMFVSIIVFEEVTPHEYWCVLTSILMILFALLTSLPLIINAVKKRSYFKEIASIVKR